MNQVVNMMKYSCPNIQLRETKLYKRKRLSYPLLSLSPGYILKLTQTHALLSIKHTLHWISHIKRQNHYCNVEGF